MDTHRRTSPIYRFGPYEVDLAAGQIRKRGMKLKLSGQPFDILVMLLERPGQAVTREEIQKRLWSDQTFVDFENSLNKAVNKLRQMLMDSAERPTYIETLPRRGYRFIGSVQRVEAGPSLPAPAALAPAVLDDENENENHNEPGMLPKSSRWRPVAFWALSAAIIAGTWFAARPQAKPRVLKAVPLTTTSRADVYGRIQTDGIRLFFVQRRGHRWELSQMPVSGGEVQPFVTPFESAKILAVSPDASEMLIAPFESRSDSLPLWIVPSVGGPPRRLADVVAQDAVFTPDGSQVTYTTPDGIFQIGRDGLNARKLVDAAGAKAGLSWSPDGKILRFDWVVTEKLIPRFRLWEVNADGRNLHKILPDWGDDGLCCGRWTHDGRYYIFVSWANGSKSMWALSEQRGFLRSQSAPVQLSTGPLFMDDPLPSPDGRYIYVLGANSHSEYVRFDAKTREYHSLIGGENAAWMTFSATGDWIVFRGAGGALWRSNPDGSQRRELAGAALDAGLPAISPNGQEIAFRATPPGSIASRIYAVSAEGGEALEIAADNFPLDDPSWSPDGSKLLYAAGSEAGTSAGLYIVDWKTRQKQKIPGSEGFAKSSWSPDGKYLAGVSEDNKTISIFDWSERKWTEVVRGNVFGPVAWSPDSQFLYYQDILEEDEPVRRMRIKDRTIEKILYCKPLLEGGIQRCGFEGLLPDGSTLFQLTRGDHDIYRLELDLP